VVSARGFPSHLVRKRSSGLRSQELQRPQRRLLLVLHFEDAIEWKVADLVHERRKGRVVEALGVRTRPSTGSLGREMNLLATVAGTPRLAGAQDGVAEPRAVKRTCQLVMERVEDDG